MALTPQFLRALEDIVGPAGLVVSAEGRLTYECDMHTFYKGTPDAVVLPESAEQVAAIVRLCRREHVPIVPRGSGTGLIGGAMAPEGGVMVSMTRMNRMYRCTGVGSETMSAAETTPAEEPGPDDKPAVSRSVRSFAWGFTPAFRSGTRPGCARPAPPPPDRGRAPAGG